MVVFLSMSLKYYMQNVREVLIKQDGIHSQGPMPPPQCFLYLREIKSWRSEGRGREVEKVSLLTHATTRGVGKKIGF